MNNYNKITIFENKRRLHALYEFRELAIEYFSDTTPLDLENGSVEGKKAKVLRVEINKRIIKISSIIRSSGLIPVLEYIPPPSIGGYRQEVDLIINFFTLDQFEIHWNQVINYIDRSIGIYEEDIFNSKIRTFNPIFWFIRLFDSIAKAPFIIIGKAGFDENKFAQSLLGRIFRLIIYFLEAFAALLAVLYYLGLLNKFLEYLKNN